MSTTTKQENTRRAGHGIFVSRWSPRSMTGKEGDDNDLVGISEAAIWALSSFNNQIWRFIYLKRNRNEWTKFVGLLNEGNRI